MPSVAPTHYAKHRGCSPQAVFDAIEKGRLQKSVEKKPTGRYVIDVDLADEEWAANTDSGTGSLAHAKNRGDDPGPEIDAEAQPMTYAEARAHREKFMAELARIELEEKQGKLIDAEGAKREAFRAARIVRDALLNLPDRVAGELAAETNQFKIHQRLTQEIRRALADLKFD